MKTTEQIQEELEKHIEHRKEIYNNPNNYYYFSKKIIEYRHII